MSALALETMGAGFGDESLGSQQVFRAALQALSHPGRRVPLAHDAEPPAGGHRASAGLLLALLDADGSVWLSPALAAAGAGAWLRFHTGCRLAESAAQAQFLWVAQGDALPALSSLAQGSDAWPEQSATCVIDVAAFDADATADWVLTGPGIQTQTALRVQGLPADFAAQWAANHAAFPCGVDVFLATAEALVGLPRTTRITDQRTQG